MAQQSRKECRDDDTLGAKDTHRMIMMMMMMVVVVVVTLVQEQEQEQGHGQGQLIEQ